MKRTIFSEEIEFPQRYAAVFSIAFKLEITIKHKIFSDLIDFNRVQPYVYERSKTSDSDIVPGGIYEQISPSSVSSYSTLYD